VAVQAGQYRVVQLLLKFSHPLECVDIFGLSPLLSAVECGEVRIFVFIISSFLSFILVYNIFIAQVRCVQALLKAGAQPNRCDRSNRTALHWAALGGHAYLCQLLQKVMIDVDFADSSGRTAVHCAAFRY